jgi:hypothetical protein
MVDNNADSDDNCTTNIHDCLGECNGDLLGTGVFECEDPDFDNEEDCPEGQWNQFGVDECGVCGGNNSCLDCGFPPGRATATFTDATSTINVAVARPGGNPLSNTSTST